MRLFTYLLCLLSLVTTPRLLAQTLLQGTVLDAQTQAPVPFASVGVSGKPLGTVADEQGRFRFTTPTDLAEPVVVSCVGYQSATVSAATLQATGQVVRLRPSGVSLAAVTVRPGKVKTKTFGRTSSSTLMGASLYTEADLVSDALAKEQGTIIGIDKDCRLRDFNMHVAFNRFKSVKFRLNLYRVKAGLPDQPLLRQDVRFDVTQPRGWVRVDLSPYQVQLQGQREVAVTIQWLQSEALEGSPKAFGVSAVPTPGHSILTRNKSQAAWQQKSGYLSFYLTADSYSSSKAAPTTPAPDYELPDSLRYLRYLAAPTLPNLSNPQHYGENAQAGHYVAVKGGRLYYERYGKGTPLLLLHGNGQSIAAFQRQIGELARHFEVLAVDTRAQGRSQDHTTADFTYDLFAEDTRQLLDSLGLRQVDILGWSDGGNTALTLALRHPAYVRRLAIMGANLFPTPEAIEPDFLAFLRRQRREEQQLPAQDLNRTRLLRILLQEPYLTFAELQGVAAPTLVMAGQHDVILEAHTRALAKALPKSELIIFPNATHYAPQEAPEAFNKAVLRFLQQR
ncbi:pimeloyl-ACP methyl ester carboxylesterase [Hymenobacter luteus]|uniref:Pimeloyl-ACP methyl ester carboxylesterase n=2 Tax=Hymenobacter TaxID=89966 RepID=A0A7W9T165_9BACT|nr:MULTISPECIES: alpha/beta fold hydrolase [Hymenobacter]MBB4602025.1 pimeloyl-ACP methyl ester carboxylesterase [Hymenobacter latericoloratus]MBB6059546.1 pimeloyl-ACP methyl ester carboxylesterase [Hymenobacter luteus]